MEYFIALLSIISVNLLLSGDNALVIALASRRLPPEQQRIAVLWGSGGAIGLRVVLTLIVAFLLKIPYLQLAGGALLLWIAVKLIADDNEQHENIEPTGNLTEAVKTIIIADFVMSLDNVVAIAGVAKGNFSLLIIGLAVSIPLIIWGSKIFGILIQKWPVVIVLGAAFLGWTAGEMITADAAVQPFIARMAWLNWGVPLFAAVVVVIIGEVMAKTRHASKEH